MSRFGPIVTGGDVRAAVEATVRLWQYDYLGELAVKSDRPRGELAMLRTFIPAADVDKLEEDQLPALVIVAAGTAEVPVKKGDGTLDARWSVGLSPIVSGQDRANTWELCELYVAALRVLVLQRPSLGGFATGVVLRGETYAELDFDDERTITAGLVNFWIDVPNIADVKQGPPAPSPAPDLDLPIPGDQPPLEPGEWPTVEDATVTVERS